MEDFLLLGEQYSEEEKLIQQSTRQTVQSWGNNGFAQAYEQGLLPDKAFEKLAVLGLFGLTLSPQIGGAGATYTAYGLACQELERGDSGLRSAASVQNSLCIYPIALFGSEEQQKNWLPKMISGEVIGCFGLTEPDAGSDPSSMRTTATPVEKGWSLNGSKMWITNATLAHLAIIWAKTPSGIQGFLVPTDSKGFSVKAIHHKLSLRASDTGEISLDNCFIPEANRLPKTEQGLSCALKCLTQARFGIAWGAMGAAMACYETALEYTQTRQQFGRPLAGFQLVQKSLVDMFTEIVKTQAVNLQVAKLMDAKKASYIHVSFAKRNACQQALKIAREARNLLGANGISGEYPVMRHLQNLETVFTYEGTDNMHTLIIGRHLTELAAFE